MRTLELNEISSVTGGGPGSNCELGITLAGAFVGGAFALATGGVGGFFVGIGFSTATHYFQQAYCY